MPEDLLGFRIGDCVRSAERPDRWGYIRQFFYNDYTVAAEVVAADGTYDFTVTVGSLEYMLLDQLAVEASRNR